VRSLLARLVGQLAMWDAATHDQPYDMDGERTESLADIRAKLADVGPAFLTQVHSIVDVQLVPLGLAGNMEGCFGIGQAGSSVAGRRAACRAE
jgi:hypothetical protein